MFSTVPADSGRAVKRAPISVAMYRSLCAAAEKARNPDEPKFAWAVVEMLRDALTIAEATDLLREHGLAL